MLTFTTTDPYCVFGGIAGKPLVPRRQPIAPDSDAFVNMYLHGDVQDLAGFDLVSLVDGEFKLAEGEHECLVELPSSKTECLLVLWNAGKTGDDRGWWKGLVVAKTDADSLSYARRCAKEKTSIL